MINFNLNHLKMPDYSQNFNRYSYALNNPLVYTDPSGEFFLGTIFTGVVEYFKAAGQSVWDFGETILVDGGTPIFCGPRGGSGIITDPRQFLFITNKHNRYPRDYKPVNGKWWEYGSFLFGFPFSGSGIIAILNLNRGR